MNEGMENIEVSTDEERLEFNKLWWGSVFEGEVIAQDEIMEVQWLITKLESQQKEIAELKAEIESLRKTPLQNLGRNLEIINSHGYRPTD
jgi:hypothetical protein